jgi:hypothetical protein
MELAFLFRCAAWACALRKKLWHDSGGLLHQGNAGTGKTQPILKTCQGRIYSARSKHGVGFKVIQGAPIDTTTSQGKLMFTMFGALAEFERGSAQSPGSHQPGRVAALADVRPSFTASKLRRAAAATPPADPAGLVHFNSSPLTVIVRF